MQKTILVFDLDNTLILRDQAMVNCIEKVFDIQLTRQQKVMIEKKDEQGHSDRIAFCQWLKIFLNLNESSDLIWENIKNNIGFFVKLNPHTISTLSLLQNEYELVLLTNGGTENQKRKIIQTGLSQFFSSNRIFISEAIGFSKPNSEAFQIVQNQFSSIQQFIMIGDHFEKDILGAKNFGWEAIYLNSNNYPKDENALTISSLKDLKQILHELRHRHE